MTKYKVVLCFKDGREIDSILLDHEPSKEDAKKGMDFYKADSYRIEQVPSKESNEDMDMFSCNHTRIGQTLARDVKLNLGGGADATVNIHLNEEGFLLIEGLGMDRLQYGVDHHDKNLLEIQILCEPFDEEEEDED